MHIGTQGFDTTDGFRRYTARDRSNGRPLGGLCLPIPAGVSCRLILDGDKHGLSLSEMSSSYGGITGNASKDKTPGVYTISISGCQAIGLFTYESGAWTNYFFQHCMAGLYNLEKMKSAISNPANTVGIVAQIGDAGLESTIDKIVSTVKIPKINMIGYNAGASAGSIDFGIRLTGGRFGGNFGEM